MGYHTPVIRIVDDDDSVRGSLTFMLTNEGYEVATYASARDFLLHKSDGEPGCLILDVKMPEMTGLELFIRLRESHYPWPIIFLTAHGDIEMAVHAVKYGAYDFVEKPIVPEKFLSLIDQALRETGTYVRHSPAERLTIERHLKELTPREKQILQLVSRGLTNRTISTRLGLSERTVENHRAAGYRKLNISSVDELIELFAIVR